MAKIPGNRLVRKAKHAFHPWLFFSRYSVFLFSARAVSDRGTFSTTKRSGKATENAAFPDRFILQQGYGRVQGKIN
jgi:hypothetical protein